MKNQSSNEGEVGWNKKTFAVYPMMAMQLCNSFNIESSIFPICQALC